MARKETINWNGCPIRYAASVFADRWNFVILRDVLFKGRRYYGDFLDAGEGISTNILADRLSKFEASGILTRHQDSKKRSRIYYLPTQKALELIPIFLSIIDWAEKHDEHTEVPEQFITAYREDADKTIAETEQLIALANAQVTNIH
ncbi:MAG: helix-turn-helix transcriptional regulator [Rhizobiaceae bacterium]|nr:helix-turn-helix transcriptional regulator [Rhizobiaceae bacterium]